MRIRNQELPVVIQYQVSFLSLLLSQQTCARICTGSGHSPCKVIILGNQVKFLSILCRCNIIITDLHVTVTKCLVGGKFEFLTQNESWYCTCMWEMKRTSMSISWKCLLVIVSLCAKSEEAVAIRSDLVKGKFGMSCLNYLLEKLLSKW